MLILAFLLAVTAVTASASDPVPSPRALLTDKDYPDAARRNEEHGDVEFILDIDAQGRPVACTVATSSGSSLLDSTTCKLQMRRGHFLPARDANGNAVPGRYRDFTSWKLLIDEPRPDAGYRVHVTFGDDGSVTACSVLPMVRNGLIPKEAHKNCDKQGNKETFVSLLGQDTRAFTSADLRTIKTDNAGAEAFGTASFRRVVADAEYGQLPSGMVTRCRVVSTPSNPAGGDLCAGALKPAPGLADRPTTSRRLIIDVVMVPRP